MTTDPQAERPELVRAKLDLARARMDVIIQEVTDDIDARVAKNVETARKEAQEIRELANLVEALMKLPVVAIAKAGTMAMCKVICDLATITARFERAFEKFTDEHGILLEEAAKQTVRQFISWVQVQEAELAPMWDAYVAALDRDLRESREENNETAATWSVVDADGLS